MSQAIHISDPAVLNALTRALVASKFQLDPVDRDVPGSTIVAELANQVADLCAQLMAEKGRRSLEQLNRWRDPAENPQVRACVQARVRECQVWKEWAREQKERYVATLLAPYFPEPTFVASACDAGDAAHDAASGSA